MGRRTCGKVIRIVLTIWEINVNNESVPLKSIYL